MVIRNMPRSMKPKHTNTRHTEDGWVVYTYSMSDVTPILSAIEYGDPHAAEQLLPLVYEELRKLAAQKLANEKSGATLQATALVHEAYLRLVDVEQAQPAQTDFVFLCWGRRWSAARGTFRLALSSCGGL